MSPWFSFRWYYSTHYTNLDLAPYLPLHYWIPFYYILFLAVTCTLCTYTYMYVAKVFILWQMCYVNGRLKQLWCDDGWFKCVELNRLRVLCDPAQRFHDGFKHLALCYDIASTLGNFCFDVSHGLLHSFCFLTLSTCYLCVSVPLPYIRTPHLIAHPLTATIATCV